jgi:hypothetical protein
MGSKRPKEVTVHRILICLAAGIVLCLGFGTRNAGAKPEGGCGNHGTSVEFVGTPSEAARQAKKEQKLVFVLHVSGHFEDPKFT